MPDQSLRSIDKPAKSAAINPPTLSEMLFAALKDLDESEDSPEPSTTRISPPSPAASAASQTPAPSLPAPAPSPAPTTNPGIPEETSEIDPMVPDPYVERCMQALREAEKSAQKQGENYFGIKSAGRDAFKRAIPPLNGEENIRGFIACITQGIILDVLTQSEATRLLYAAQVAHTASRRAVQPARSPGRPRG